jgi:hypothetical protein
MKIIVLKPFVEVRSGRSYQPGDEVSDPAWHDPASRKAEAYAARGLVRVDMTADIPPEAGEDMSALGAGGE